MIESEEGGGIKCAAYSYLEQMKINRKMKKQTEVFLLNSGSEQGERLRNM